MLKKPLAMTIGLSLLALAACTNGHKLEVRRTLGKGKTADEAVKNKDADTIITGNTQCLPLFSLVKQLTEKNSGIPFTVYVQSRSLTTDSGIYTDDPKMKLGLLDSRISDTKYGTDLKSSPVVGDLLRVSDQSDCKTVTFLNADGTVMNDGIYDVDLSGMGTTTTTRDAKGNQVQTQQQGAPGRLTLKSRSGNIKREYRYDGSDLLTIDVTVRSSGVQACDGKTPTVGVRTVYIMSLSGGDKHFRLDKDFGMLLADSMAIVPPKIEQSVKNLRDAQAKPTDNKRTTGASASGQQKDNGLSSGMIKTDLGELNAISDYIIAKRFKTISCK